MAEKEFRAVEYVKRKDLDLAKFKYVAPTAKAIVNAANPEDKLVIRVGVNSPITLEAAAPLTLEGIRTVAKAPIYKGS